MLTQNLNDRYQKVLKVANKQLAADQEKKEIADILSDISENEKIELAKKINQQYLTTENSKEKMNLSGMGLYIKWFETTWAKKIQQQETTEEKKIINVELLRTGVVKISYTTNKRNFQIVIYKENNTFKVRINEQIGKERKKIRDKDQNLPYQKKNTINNNPQELLINIGKILDYHAGTNRKKIPDEVQKAYQLLKTWTNTEIKINKPITENIKYQKEYLEQGFRENVGQKQLLESYYQKQKPMKKETKIVVSFPVNKYEDIEKTLESYTTGQKNINKNEYEMVILFNRPNKETKFDQTTKNKIDEFIKKHPEYNITVFEHTFDFPKWEKVNMGKIYKLLWDMILYRNIQRLNTYPDMDPKRVDQLIMRMWGADSTKKNPEFLKSITDEFDTTPKLVRLTTESRLDPELVQNFPLLQIDATLESAYNRFRSKGKANSVVGNGTFKAHLYAEIWWHNAQANVSEDVDMVSRMSRKIREKKYQKKHLLKKNAIDNSADRPIHVMIQGKTYFDRYNSEWFGEKDKTKNINRERRAIENKGKDPRLNNLAFTKDNIEREFSRFYTLKFLDMQKKSEIYRIFLQNYKDKFGKEPTTEEKTAKIREIVDKLISRAIARWLGIPPRMFNINHGDVEVGIHGGQKRIYAKRNNHITISNEAMKLLQEKWKEKVANNGFTYR